MKDPFRATYRAPTKQGAAGYDNPRENIDPHLKTQAFSTSEMVAKTGVFAGNLNSNRILVGDGTEAAPSFAFTSDTNTGMYLNTADQIGWSLDGVQKAKLTASGMQLVGDVLPTTAKPMTIRGLDTNSATAVGVVLNASTALTTAGAKLTSFQNNEIEKAYIDYLGGAYFDGEVETGNTISINGQLKFKSVSTPVNTMAYTLGGPGNVDDGVHRYKVMFTTADGDTGLSTDYLVVTITDKTTNGQVLLTGIPISTNEKVTGRRIFRGKIGVSTSSYYLVYTINDNTTTTYTDNAADASIGTVDYRNIENVTAANIWRDGGKYGQIAANNFGLGYYCLGSSSTMTGWYNFALGRNVMRYCTTGTANTGIGQFALNTLASGSYNIAVGTEV